MKKIVEKSLENAISYKEYKDLVKKNKYVYQEIIETEKGIKYKDKDLFDDWIRDTKIRSYKNINFIPKLNNEINIDYFNTFQGFDGEFINDYTKMKKQLNYFINTCHY